MIADDLVFHPYSPFSERKNASQDCQTASFLTAEADFHDSLLRLAATDAHPFPAGRSQCPVFDRRIRRPLLFGRLWQAPVLSR